MDNQATKKHKRRDSREVAFALIFEWGFRQDENLDDVISQAIAARAIEADSFALNLASVTVQNISAIDNMIQKYSVKWKLNRIPKVTLAVLRMSFCEMSFLDDIPVGATINEAVELVKKYATEDDSAYVNGLLGQYERERMGNSVPNPARSEG